jgi:hypothetical protein
MGLTLKLINSPILQFEFSYKSFFEPYQHRLSPQQI